MNYGEAVNKLTNFVNWKIDGNFLEITILYEGSNYANKSRRELGIYCN